MKFAQDLSKSFHGFVQVITTTPIHPHLPSAPPSRALRERGSYYQKINHAEENVIVITGSVQLTAGGEDGLEAYCEQFMQRHEDELAKIMADGTDDLITDLCIRTAGECTQEAVARIPTVGLPASRRQGS